jgi:dihydropteroate synthase
MDTMKPAVAREALQRGASIINDVAANRTDDGMWRLAAETGAGYILMHMQGAPATMQSAPAYDDVVAEVADFFRERLARLSACGVAADHVALDPGIGFGKTREHNLKLLANIGSFTVLGRPLLLGVSRKSFLGGAEERLAAGLACMMRAREAGVGMFRVHDAAETVRALRMVDAAPARKKN